MRRPTGPASLRLKVILLVLSVCTVALAVAIATFVAYQYRDLRARTVLRVAALAQVTADNCSSALAFRDARTAAETLEALAVDQRIVGAAIYSRRGELFASFERPGAQVRFQAPVPGQPDTFSAGRVTVARPIRFERRALGTIVLIGDLAVLEKQVADLVRLGLAVLLAALLLAAMLASRLQRMVTAPVLRLAAAAEQVAERQDFSLRVAPGPADEIGLLTENFNRMLARIERSDQELRESEQRFAVAVAGARDGIWEWRLDLGNAYYSPRWKEMLGHADSELSDRPSEWTERIHPDELPRVHALLAEHLDGKSPRFEAEFRMRHRDGRWIWVLARAVAQRDAAGKVTRLAGSLTDVTDRRGRDVLTGLWNRSKFTEYIESALERTRSASGRGFAVLFVELEQLRAISDAHGRAPAGTCSSR
ncbi:MAG: PAS domain-containing protein, partial [Thermoanaerobaculia bacterium]|nr:PAS domain-containing protein [Thermoanaerobaculia bacterium]